LQGGVAAGNTGRVAGVGADGMSLVDASRGQLAVRRAKVAALQLSRLAAWATQPGDWRRPVVADSAGEFPFPLYRRQVQVARQDAGADPVLEAGKQVNVALAAPHFDGVVLSPDAPLSFWRCLGRVTAARGYRPGLELRGGCLVPTVGGGLCLLSNALFAMAAELGWTIHERHGHTLEATPPPATGPWGVDATVFWPHVDLRFAPRRGRVRLSMRAADGVLELGADGEVPQALRVELRERGRQTTEEAGERFRSNQVVRTVVDECGRVVEERVIALNRKRLLEVTAQRRTCLSCDEVACHARPRSLPLVPPPRPSPARGGGS
jgi:vancomycin resistance protein VanW